MYGMEAKIHQPPKGFPNSSVSSLAVVSPGGMGGSGSPHLCSDPFWDKHKSFEKFFYI